MCCEASAQLDIVIPVYNEGPNILRTLKALDSYVKTDFRVLICYDFDEDNTLTAIRKGGARSNNIHFVKNGGSGPHQAVISGFKASNAPFILVYPADDDYNAGILDAMVQQAMKGNDIVCASRFIPGGNMVDCPWLKNAIVRTAARSLYHLARVPSHDSTNGFRMFSRRVINEIQVESCQGFSYSLELLTKCHRLGWPIAEIPAKWYERTTGKSRFRVLKWLPAYLRWYFYAYATTYLRRPPQSVPFKGSSASDHPIDSTHERTLP